MNNFRTNCFLRCLGTFGPKWSYGAKEVAITLALRRAEQRKPKEDEINAIENKEHQEKEGAEWARHIDETAWETYWWGYEEECDVDAVDMGKGSLSAKCHRCSGIGHIARDCASPWDMLGKNKGAQKGGKPGKGGMQWGGVGGNGRKGGKAGHSKAPKGKGKGYQGYCFDCGQQGHKRGEPACWMAASPQPIDVNHVSTYAEKDYSDAGFGGGAIWEVAQIEVRHGHDAENHGQPCEAPCERSSGLHKGWTVVTNMTMKRVERKNEASSTQENQN